MTAEIGILNRSAVALAADSAVTIDTHRGNKIFNTVNKLFTLSKYHPVGVMVYGSAHVMNAPWETVIKIYRKKLGKRRLNHLEEYSTDFFRFLARNTALFSAAEQRDYFGQLVMAFYVHVNEKIDARVKKELETHPLTARQRGKITSEVVDAQFVRLRRLKNLRGFSDRFAAKLLRRYGSIVESIRKKVFQELPLSPEDKRKLRAIAGLLVVRNDFGMSNRSGLVIAGFGEKDTYPRLQEFAVEGVIAGMVRCRLNRSVRIGIDTDASINAFAQSEVVQSFIDGVDPNLEKVLLHFVEKILADYPPVLLQCIPSLTRSAKKQVIKKAEKASQQILRDLTNGIGKFRRENLVDPVVSTVGVLPKNELAAMAETLVSLTSFKRRFSFDSETVGGPIDVAVLSKGDGFVWIKRKHYFEQNLNPHFATRYFDGG